MAQEQKELHKCNWNGSGKFYMQCTIDDCKNAAVICNKHTKNMSPELFKWLKTVKVNVKHLTQMAIYSPGKLRIDMSKLSTNNSHSLAKKTVTPQQRVKLQEGKMDLQMSDDELVEFFNEDLKKTMKTTPEVRPIPEGDAVFIFCVFKGKKGPVQAFIDHGCNCWVAEEGIPETELVACKLQDGPFPMGVASGVTVYANAEWAGLIPLADGSHQIVRGLTVPKVTQDMPEVDLHQIYDNLKKKCKSNNQVQKLKVPKIVGGKIQMILGIKYQNIFPEPIHTFPNGLTIFKSKLMPANPGAVACIGGPVAAIGELAGVMGYSTTTYLTNLLMKNYKPRMEFFPDMEDKIDMQDQNIPGIKQVFADIEEVIDMPDNPSIDEVFDVEDDNKESDELVSLLCTVCGVVENQVVEHFGCSVQSEIQKFMQMQDVGLDASYKCPACRECETCKKGSGFKNISLKQEAEQELIKQCVYIDTELNRPMARLPFKADPNEFLADNHYIANKRLLNVCNKYYKQEAVRDEINHAFDKLRKRGHLKYYEDLNVIQREKLIKAEAGYTIPWDVVWKATLISTPARPVFDASSKTSTGHSLNDILATGVPDLAKLLDVVLEWQIGPKAFVGDVSQFYCTIGLEEESWPFQKLLLRKDLNPNGELILAVITSLIFGVCSSGGISEVFLRRFSDTIRNSLPEVAKLISKNRYVDDILKSCISIAVAKGLIKDTEETLKDINMEIKGWCLSGEDPPKELTDDGATVSLAGMTWFPKIDGFSLNISKLHFSKKKRGKYDPNIKIFDDSSECLEDFVPHNLSRRQCTSVVARIYDLTGKLAPITLKFKDGLRKSIDENPSWDEPISPRQRLLWIDNFRIINDVREIIYIRCTIPENATSLKARFYILCDAANGGVMVGVYAGFPLPDGSWSCNNLLGKGLLVPDSWTIPKKELHALNTASNVKAVVDRALEDWIQQVYVAGDSEIALAWTIYENVKLNVFHSHRVNNMFLDQKILQIAELGLVRSQQKVFCLVLSGCVERHG